MNFFGGPATCRTRAPPLPDSVRLPVKDALPAVLTDVTSPPRSRKCGRQDSWPLRPFSSIGRQNAAPAFVATTIR